MLSKADRLAIQRHAAVIEKYEADSAAEHARLVEPFRARHLQTWDELHGDELLTSEQLTGMVTSAHFGWGEPEDMAAARADVAVIQDAMAVFDAAHRPHVESFDTPKKLVAWIDEKFWRWEMRPRLLSDTETGRAALKANGWTYRKGESPCYPDGEARDDYREARRRALAFAMIAPTLPGEIPECHDPIVGLQDIRTCFALLDTEPEPSRNHLINLTVGDDDVRRLAELAEQTLPVVEAYRARDALTPDKTDGIWTDDKMDAMSSSIRAVAARLRTLSDGTYPEFPTGAETYLVVVNGGGAGDIRSAVKGLASLLLDFERRALDEPWRYPAVGAAFAQQFGVITADLKALCGGAEPAPNELPWVVIDANGQTPTVKLRPKGSDEYTAYPVTTECAAFLEGLLNNNGNWVSLPELVKKDSRLTGVTKVSRLKARLRKAGLPEWFVKRIESNRPKGNRIRPGDPVD